MFPKGDSMEKYRNGLIQVIFSTYDVVYDSSYVRDVIVMEGSQSPIGFLQALGRI